MLFAQYKIETQIDANKAYSSIYIDNICIRSNVQTLIINKVSTFNKWNTKYYPEKNIVIIGNYGLRGGGACNEAQNSNIRSVSNPAIINEFKFNESTKDLSLNLQSAQPYKKIITDDRKENAIKKHLWTALQNIKSGLNFSYQLKQIEEAQISMGINFYGLCNNILDILSTEELYKKKIWNYHREKLSNLAKRFLIYQIAYTEDCYIPGAYEAAQISLSKIHLYMDNLQNSYPETGFYLNVKSIEALIEAIKYESIKYHPLSGILIKIIEDYRLKRNSTKNIAYYLKTSKKNNRSVVCDLILLDFMGDHDNKQMVVRNLMDMNCNLPWEHLALVLDYASSTFKPVECIQFLGEYIYYSSFEKDVWRVSSKAIELLIQYAVINQEEYVELIWMIIEEKKRIENEPEIKKQLDFINVYQESVRDYMKFPKSYSNYTDKMKLFPKNVEIIDKIQETKTIFMLISPSKHKALAITGDKGIGKTNLALSYAKNNSSHYKSLYFIRAFSTEVIHKEFIKLSQKLKLLPQDTLTETISAVLRYFNNYPDNFLIIFDDVQKINQIKEFLPNNGHIIITSIDRNWDFRYELETLNSEIAEEFINKYICEHSEDVFEYSKWNWSSLNLIKRLKTTYMINSQQIYARICTNEYDNVYTELIKIPDCSTFLACISLLENFSMPIMIAETLFKSISDDSAMTLELIFTYLKDLGLMQELKNFKIIFSKDLLNYIQNKTIDKRLYLNIISTSFSKIAEMNFFKIAKTNYYIGRLLLLKHFEDYEDDISIGCLYFLKGHYQIHYKRDYKTALEFFEKSLCIFKKFNQQWEHSAFGVGSCNLHLSKIESSIANFKEIIELTDDIDLKNVCKAYLIKAYEVTGRGVNIRDIIFDSSSNLTDLPDSHGTYFVIHGICRLFLTEKSLKNLISPYTSILHSNIPSILLLRTLFHLSLFFTYKERWTTVLAYINHIAPLLGVTHLLQPSNLHSTLETIIQLLQEIKHKIEIIAGESHQIISYIHIILAKIYATNQQNDQRKHNLELALQIRLQNGTHDFSVAEIQYELAKFHGIKLKDTDYARSFLSQAEKTVQEIAGEENILYAKVLEMRGLLYLIERNFTQAGELLQKSFSIKKIILEKSPDNEELSQGYAALGKLEYKLGNLQQSIQYYSKALEPNHKMYLSSFWAAKAYKISLKLENFKEALEFKSQHIRMLTNLYEPNSDTVFNEYQKAYKLAVEIHSYEQANNIALASLDILRRIGNSNSIEYSESMYLIKVADSYLKIKMYDEAECCLNESIEVAKNSFGINSKEYANAKCALGIFYKEIRKYAKAITELSNILDLLDVAQKAKIYTDIGLCYMKRKCIDEASSAFANSLKMYKEQNRSLDAGKVYILLSYLYESNEFLSSKYLKKAIDIYNKEFGNEHTETINLESRLKLIRKSSLAPIL